MHPAAEDNYGYDACAILCLPCVPNILVIATQSGVLYHCVVLEGEEEDDQTVSRTPGVGVGSYGGGGVPGRVKARSGRALRLCTGTWLPWPASPEVWPPVTDTGSLAAPKWVLRNLIDVSGKREAILSPGL